MKILLEVFADLWNFATFGIFKNKRSKKEKQLSLDFKKAHGETKEVEEIEKIARQPFVQSETKVQVVDLGMTPINTNGYVCVDEARTFVRPVWAFDGAFKVLLFGSLVQIIRYEGRFAQVRKDDLLGWVLKDEVTTEYSDIFPIFHKNITYLYEHTETKKLRKLTKDEFFAIELSLPLQAVEYVSYILYQDGRKIPWLNERPRLAGNWQNLLKGHLGVHIGLEPKTGSVMEYQYRDGTGHVGYVKEVHADESIVFLSVGREVDGKYTEEQFNKTKWQEYRPVFIQVS